MSYLCTYPNCGRPEDDDTVHPQTGEERIGGGRHIFSHREPKAKKSFAGSVPGIAIADPPNPLEPSVGLLGKLGSLLVHYQELVSHNGRAIDKIAVDTLEADLEVGDWLAAMTKMALLPVKR